MKASSGIKRHILVDQGNTYCKVATCDEGIFSPLRVYRRLDETLLCELVKGYRPEEVESIYCSVSTVDQATLHLLERSTRRCLVLTAATPTPLTGIHYQKGRLGVDRLALAVGAHWLSSAREPRELLVMDIGTAITIDRIDSQGRFLGGNISPGPQTRIRALHQSTSLLPMVELSGAAQGFGLDTETAIRKGTLQGIGYELEGYRAQFHRNYPDGIVFMTGGYACHFVDQVKNVTFVVSNLIMMGLNRILEYND